jgi:hypothetical protein
MKKRESAKFILTSAQDNFNLLDVIRRIYWVKSWVGAIFFDFVIVAGYR